jgi:hypothetical protein
MPDFDFDAFNHDQLPENGEHAVHENGETAQTDTYLDPAVQVSAEEIKDETPAPVQAQASPSSSGTDHLEEVDKW